MKSDIHFNVDTKKQRSTSNVWVKKRGKIKQRKKKLKKGRTDGGDPTQMSNHWPLAFGRSTSVQELLQVMHVTSLAHLIIELFHKKAPNLLSLISFKDCLLLSLISVCLRMHVWRGYVLFLQIGLEYWWKQCSSIWARNLYITCHLAVITYSKQDYSSISMEC